MSRRAPIIKPVRGIYLSYLVAAYQHSRDLSKSQALYLSKPKDDHHMLDIVLFLSCGGALFLSGRDLQFFDSSCSPLLQPLSTSSQRLGFFTTSNFFSIQVLPIISETMFLGYHLLNRPHCSNTNLPSIYTIFNSYIFPHLLQLLPQLLNLPQAQSYSVKIP